MTPDQHRAQAALLRRSDDPEAKRRAGLHARLATMIEQRELQGSAPDSSNEREEEGFTE